MATNIMGSMDGKNTELEEDILRFKNKVQMDRDYQQRHDRSLSIMPNQKLDSTPENNTEKLSLSLGDNYKLVSIQLYNNETDNYESKLVYMKKEFDYELDEKIRHQVDEEFGSDDEYSSENNYTADFHIENFNDVFESVKLDQLLKPITKPSDVINIKPVNRIYNQNYLERLSEETISIIEKEQQNVNLLNKIMDIFLHNDPDHILADKLGLPIYDHHLDIENEQSDINNKKKLKQFENDPFFQPPTYESDPKFDGIDKDEIDETRQLIQIALQRNEEFVRSLSQIRMGFIHADNYREQIYGWCKEINENEITQNQKKSNEKE